MLPANSIATTWLASSWSVQFVCPSGALLHAMATRCASCLPLSLRSRPDRGRSLIAASSPSSANRLRTLATVAALIETASAASRSESPSSAFNSARARFTVRANGLPRPDVSIRAERSVGQSSGPQLPGKSRTATPCDACSDCPGPAAPPGPLGRLHPPASASAGRSPASCAVQ